GAHGFRFGEAQVDGDAAAAVGAGDERAPVGDATAVGAEMETDGPVAPGVHRGGAGDADPFVLEVVGPEHAVAAAHRAVAGGGRLGDSLEAPADGAAMTGAFDHDERRTAHPPPAGPSKAWIGGRLPVKRSTWTVVSWPVQPCASADVPT